jgi:outer membrane receptor protein involved in Fe transport
MFKGLILLLACAICTTSMAQTRDTVKNIGDENIVVVKDYQPTLSDAVKISAMPLADTATAKDLNFNYTIESKRADIPFNTSPIKPVKIKDDEIKALSKGYLRGGYGTHNTPYAELFYNALRSKEFDAGIHFKHHSSTGKIKNYGKTDNSENELELFGKKFTDKGTLRTDLNFNRDVFRFYGYDRRSTVYSKAETRQLFSGIDGTIGFDNFALREPTYHFDAGLSFYGYSGKREADKTNESSVVFNGKLQRKIADRIAFADVKIDYSRTRLPLDTTVKNTIVGIYPRYTFEFPVFRLIAGVNTEWEANLNPKFHLYPHVEARYKLASDVLMIYAKLSGDMQKNNYREISRENPFTGNLVLPANTNNKLNLSAGINVKLDKEILFSASGSFRRANNEMYFVNDSAGPLQYTTFSTVYSDADIITLKGELVFERPEAFNIHLGATYTNNKPDDLAKPWFVPAVAVNLGGHILLREKIIFKTDMFYRGERYAVAYNGDSFLRMKPYFDANLSLEYRYTKKISVFLNVNNLGSVQYFKWVNYPSYRLQLLAGATLSF